MDNQTFKTFLWFSFLLARRCVSDVPEWIRCQNEKIKKITKKIYEWINESHAHSFKIFPTVCPAGTKWFIISIWRVFQCNAIYNITYNMYMHNINKKQFKKSKERKKDCFLSIWNGCHTIPCQARCFGKLQSAWISMASQWFFGK